MPEMARATVTIKVGKHDEGSCPQGMATFLEDKITEAGVLCPCNARLGWAVHASGGTQGDFHAVNVGHGGVIVVAQCGNNKTRRRLHLTCEGITPEELCAKIDATFGKSTGTGDDDNEGAGDDDPPTVGWFPNDKTAIGLYLIELEPLLRKTKGAPNNAAEQTVKEVAKQLGYIKPRGKDKTYGQILSYLVGYGVIKPTATGTNNSKGWRCYYQLTDDGEATLAATHEPVVAPEPLAQETAASTS
jgi:hypothetical protein